MLHKLFNKKNKQSHYEELVESDHESESEEKPAAEQKQPIAMHSDLSFLNKTEQNIAEYEDTCEVKKIINYIKALKFKRN
jgi:hypothetical protein